MRRSIPRTTYAADRPFLHNLWIAKGGECSNLNGLRSSTEMSPYEAYTCSASERIRRCGAFPRASARCIRCRLVLSVRSVRLASVLALRDLDYEGKYEKTRPYFTLFLKELYKAMGPKWVQCTVESRTPIADRYYGTTPPADAGKYANDFVALNKYCDRVRFMTYDQQNVDQKREAEVTEPYGPVSDTVWVEKAIREAMKTIPKSKIILGIPTYGYEWDVTTYANNEHMYDLLWTFNPQHGWDLAKEYNITPGRNAGGELGFTYFPKGSALSMGRPAISWPFNLVASAASAMTTSNNSNMTYRMVTWSDSQAIADKVALAHKLGIRGVAIFKIDGGQDQGMWSVLK